MRAWLNAGQSQAAILDAFLAAGRALEAAHDAGVIHRDFKPENVLVGRDGRIRVVDFGLAGLDGSVEQTLPETAADVDRRDVSGDVKLTQTGAMMGTPLYMAPEQFEGRATDTRTDQFAFCVGLHEAVYGVRPFSGPSLLELSEAVRTGRIVEPPRERGVSFLLRRAILRGLAVDPSRRFADMGGLLDALEATRSFGQTRGRVVFAGVVLASAVAAGMLWAAQRTTEPEASPGPVTTPEVVDERRPDPSVAAPLVARQLTRSGSASLDIAEANATGERLLYMDDSGVWERDLEGGQPERIDIEFGDDSLGDGVTFGPVPGEHLLVMGTELLRRDATGELTRVIDFGVQPDPSWTISPDRRYFLNSGDNSLELWDLEHGSVKRTSTPPYWIVPSWAPDSSQFAMVVETKAGLQLRVLDLELSVQQTLDLDKAVYSLLYTGQRSIALSMMHGGPHKTDLELGCVRLGSAGLDLEQNTRALSGHPEGTALMLTSRAGSAALVALGSEARSVTTIIDLHTDERSATTRNSASEERHPHWLSNEELVFTSNRFMNNAIFHAQFEHFEEATIVLETEFNDDKSVPDSIGGRDNAGGFFRIEHVHGSGDPSPEHRVSHHRPPSFEPDPAFSLELPPGHISSLTCTATGRCSFTLEHEIRVFERESGRTEFVHPCPLDSCDTGVPISPDGQRLFVPSPTGGLFLDAESGEELDTLTESSIPPIPYRMAAWSDDGRALFMGGEDDTGTSWLIRLVLAESEAEIIRQDSDSVLSGFSPSPDGRRLALALWQLDYDAYLIELADFCGDE